MKNKKAQMEMMGLVLIVILATLAMLFVIQFVILREPSEIKKEFTHKELSANTLNAITKTDTRNCKGQSILQLLQDCAAGEFIICDNGVGSCNYAKLTLEEIFENTLETWNKAYYFNADLARIEISNGDCTGEKKTSTHPVPVPDLGDTMLLTLEICG